MKYDQNIMQTYHVTVAQTFVSLRKGSPLPCYDLHFLSDSHRMGFLPTQPHTMYYSSRQNKQWQQEMKPMSSTHDTLALTQHHRKRRGEEGIGGERKRREGRVQEGREREERGGEDRAGAVIQWWYIYLASKKRLWIKSPVMRQGKKAKREQFK